MLEKTEGTIKNGQSRDIDNVATQYTEQKMLEKTDGTIKNGQSRETGNIGHTRHRTNKC
jgi:hypothetical protein